MTTAIGGQPVPQRRGLLARVQLAAADIKLAHSVFALPFAILAAFLARPADPAAAGGSAGTFAAQLAIIVLCMVFARSWAMLVNRIADRHLDAANPRTDRRAVASGRLSPHDAALIALACATLFVGACALFLTFFANPWPVALSVPVLVWIAFYSYTKRFTALCHLFLGGALAVSPIAAAIAVNQGFALDISGTGRPVWLLAGFVLLWVAGFDVIYALQDLDFDRASRLRSIPSAIGWRGAIWFSRALHAGSFTLLIFAAKSEARFGWVFFAAVTLVGTLLVVEHAILARRGRAGLEMAFFTVNGIISCILGAAGILDLTWA